MKLNLWIIILYANFFFSVYNIVLLSITDIYPSWLFSFLAFSQVTNTVRWDLGMRLVDLHVAVHSWPLACSKWKCHFYLKHFSIQYHYHHSAMLSKFCSLTTEHIEHV